MAEATMTEIVDAVAVLLRAALSIDVEEYTPWAPSESARAWIEEGAEDGEDPAHFPGAATGGVFWTRKRVRVVVQEPWDETNTACESLRTNVETVKTTIKANRDLTVAAGDSPQNGLVDGVGQPMLVQYHDNPIHMRQVTVDASWLC